tara:strand:- start:1932 stop:2555 length:624 start_codon:yes stop_codon:yes gene_type:complete
MLKRTNLNIKSTTVSKNALCWEKYLTRIEYFCNELKKDEYDDRLLINYTPERLNIDEWIALTIYEDNKKIYGFSTVINRPFWGKGARILNRFFKIKGYRFENDKRKISDATINMIKEQLSTCKALGYEYAFMSRETQNPSAIKAWNHYGKYFKMLGNWNIPEESFQMTEYPEKLSCWQQIIWTPLKEGSKPAIDSITKEELYEKFKT